MFVFKRSAIGIEDPGFIRAKSITEQLQLPCYPISVDEEGCCVPDADEPVKLLYTTPAHQYPTGTIMSIARRVELLNWAIKQSAYIIEDDYDSEFRYKGTNPSIIPSGFNRAGTVLRHLFKNIAAITSDQLSGNASSPEAGL